MKIIVPATTSNISSGFDVLGIALNIFLEVEFDTNSSSFKIEGCPFEYCSEENQSRRFQWQVGDGAIRGRWECENRLYSLKG